MIARALDDHANELIQGLWIGSELSVMERLSISSFLANGHPFDLYVYSDLPNVPDGTTIRDANEIMPSSSIFRYRENGSYAGFSNFFRYELLLQRGGWWVDLDTICMQPFTFGEDYVIGAEPVAAGGAHPISGVLKTPPHSELMTYLVQICRSKDPNTITWGETGPRLVAEAVKRFSLEAYLQTSEVFCPIGWYEWDRILDAGLSISLHDSTRAVHLWNEMWRQDGKDKDAQYDPGCLYELLKAKYL
ncbi:MAG: glycosyltransferase [Planctomycetota bacterium]